MAQHMGAWTSFVMAVAAALALAPTANAATPSVLDPSAPAAFWRDFGGPPAPSALRLVYKQDDTAANGAKRQGDVVIDVAANWVAVNTGESTAIFDFRSNRRISISPAQRTFTSTNLLGSLFFRISEIQNRMGLVAMSDAAKLGLFTMCDAETDVSIALPGVEQATQLKRSGARTEVACGGAIVGAFETDATVTPPAAFWRALAQVRQMHPGMRKALEEARGAPRYLRAEFSVAPKSRAIQEWRLQSSSQTTADYPLPADFTNGFSAAVDTALGAGAGQLALDAMGGKAAGGAPTLEAWDARLKRIEAQDGLAALALNSFPSLHMFPELATACATSDRESCRAMKSLRQAMAEDVAVGALLSVAQAEQTRQPALAINAMRTASTSRNAKHPALGAAFAMALLSGGPALADEAKKAGLPDDPLPLQRAAVAAYPYSPAYWTDIGDGYASRYDYERALTFYEIAFALPIPGAKAPYTAPLSARLRTMEKVRTDFASFFLE